MTSSTHPIAPRSAVRVAEYPPSATFGPRQLGDYEFVWVLNGSARWRVSETDHETGMQRRHDHTLHPGTLALARAGTVESYRWDDRHTSAHAYVHFELESTPGSSGPHTWPLTRPMRQGPPFGALCAYLLALASIQTEQARTRSDQLIGLLFDLFLSGPFPPPATEPPISERLLPAIDSVRARWETSGMRIVHVDELAAASHLSAAHLSRLFKHEFGCGPATALELIRLGRAAITLQRSNATLAEVAELSGFSNPYHFSRRFSSAYGKPPGRFRMDGDVGDPLWPVGRAGLLPLWRTLTTREWPGT